NVIHVNLSVMNRLPRMRIIGAMVMVMIASMTVVMVVVVTFVAVMFLFGIAQQPGALGQLYNRCSAAACLDEALKKTFKMRAIGQNHVGIPDRCRIGRPGFISMGIAVGADQCGQRNTFAAHVLREVTDDRER